MKHTKSGILLIGNFLSSILGTYGVCEELAIRLNEDGYQTYTTSSHLNVVKRLIDMVSTTWMRRHDYDIALIDTYSYRAFLWAEASSWTLRQAKKPYILTLHAGHLPEFEREQPQRVRRLLRSATAVTTPSLYLKQALSHVRDDIIHLPNAIDLKSYPFRERASSKPRLVWLRAFADLYQPQLAIRTLAIVKRKYPEIKLVMFGRDTYDGSLDTCKSLILELGLKENVSIQGKIAKQDVPASLAASDIFLNTTRAESFGVAVMEAAALGQCIVTTNVGELPYIWTDNNDALLVPPDKPEAMAAVVIQILENPDLSLRLSKNARSKAEHYNWEQTLKVWNKLIETSINSFHRKT